jgi:hypothetical protein
LKKWLATAKEDNRGESLRALQEVSKERITSVADQYFTNLWRVGASQSRGAPSIEYRDRRVSERRRGREGERRWRSEREGMTRTMKGKLHPPPTWTVVTGTGCLNHS